MLFSLWLTHLFLATLLSTAMITIIITIIIGNLLLYTYILGLLFPLFPFNPFSPPCSQIIDPIFPSTFFFSRSFLIPLLFPLVSKHFLPISLCFHPHLLVYADLLRFYQRQQIYLYHNTTALALSSRWAFFLHVHWYTKLLCFLKCNSARED